LFLVELSGLLVNLDNYFLELSFAENETKGLAENVKKPSSPRHHGPLFFFCDLHGPLLVSQNFRIILQTELVCLPYFTRSINSY
jgi:hypothetical protein